jgi:ribose 5-phosphate isomerase A
MTEADLAKFNAAQAALDYIKDGMIVGLGTGSTSAHFVRALGQRVRQGLRVRGVPTSEATRNLAEQEGVPLVEISQVSAIDVDVDGADEVDTAFRLVKGGGGALLREKIVAAASARMIVIADETKVVDTLGAFPLPIEVNPFGLAATRIAVEKLASRLGLSGEIGLRQFGEDAFTTDGGHHILDASFGRIPDAEALATQLNSIPGVVEHGLFINLASFAIIAGEAGARTLKAK